jgi:LysR family glycine cleavage system transcriptional activator
MPFLMADLPPLNAVRVFEAVVRHGNLTRAATELNLTQSAVSYQVRLIEGFVGAPLFQRLARGVSLTPRGEELAAVAQRALGELRNGFRQARDETGKVLTISTMQTFGGSWLAPRLGRFQLEHPGYAVRLDISARLVDLAGEDVDVVVRTGKGSWPGLVSHLLMDQNFTPMASPHYLAREGRPEKPADMARHLLIARTDEWWGQWFECAGLPRDTAMTRASIDVETQQMAATLAIAGTGIALISPGFVSDDLKSGRLVQLFDLMGASGSGYYLAYLESRRRQPKIRAFRDWVLAEAKHASMETMPGR